MLRLGQNKQKLGETKCRKNGELLTWFLSTFLFLLILN